MAQLKSGSTAGGQIIATQDWVTANLIDAAPTALNTLNELAAALGDDPNFATTITNSIATKAPLSGSYGTDFYVNALYYDDWVRNHSNNNGIYWSTTGWHLYPESNLYFRVRSGNSGGAALRFNTGGTDRNFIYVNNANEIGFLNTGGSWIFKVDNAGVLQTGNIPWARLSSVPSTFAPSAHTHAISDVTGLQTALDGKQAAGTYLTSLPSHNHDDRYYTETEIDNFSYWRDNQDRRISVLRFTGEGGDSGHGRIAYGIYQEGGAWTHPYPNLRINMHTGMSFGANSSYGGYRFMSDYNTDTIIFSINDGDANVRVTNNLYIGSAGGWITDLLNSKQAAGSYAAASHSHDYVATNGSSWSPHPSTVREAGWNTFYTDHGYISLGPANASWAHIYSDKSFYFNQNIYVNNAKLATEAYVTSRGYITASHNHTIGDVPDIYRLFNNMGDNHSARNSFDAQNTTSSMGFGWRFVQGGTNGPGVGNTGNGQYYALYVGLGNDYGPTQYGMQIAIPRASTTPYLSLRFNEGSLFGAWQKISAGYADSAGAVAWGNVTGKPSTFSPSTHTHELEDVNNLVEVIAEIDGLISGKAAASHTHDDRYYTESESDGRFARKDTNSAIGGNLVIGNGTYGVTTAYGNSGARLMFNGSDTDAQGNYYIGTNHQDYGGNYSKLDLRWHTGIRMGAQPGYGGIRFFSNEDLGTRIMSIGETDANVRIDNNLWIGGAGGWITDLLAAKQAAGSYAAASHSHAISDVTGLQGALDGKQAAGSYAASDHNHQYNVNNSWLRDNGDNANVKLYGNTRQMAFRTDGTTEYASGVGGYAFAWMYGGDAAGDRRMLLASDGRLWTNYHGWLDSAFAAAGHNHDGTYLAAGGKAADSNLLDGLDLHTGRNNEANKVVRTDGNGYIQAGWINTPSGATTSTLTKIYASQDDYIRYVTPAEFRRQITDGVYQAAGSYAAASHTHTPSQVGLGNVSNAAQVTTSYNSSLNSDSRNSRGVTRLYRRDSDSDYSVQTYWTGSYWRLYGYNGDNGHADTQVGYANSAGSASSASSATTATNVNNGNTYTSGNNLYIQNSGVSNYRVHHNGSDGVFDVKYRFSTRNIDNIWSATQTEWNGYMAFFWLDIDPWGDNWGVGSRPTSWKTVNRGSFLTFGFEDWSDRRSKSAIVEIDNAVDKVKAIGGYTYWKVGSEVREAGVIAQDVLEVFPEAIGGTEEGYSVKPAALIGLLSKAVKEQQAMIDALTARIEALENK